MLGLVLGVGLAAYGGTVGGFAVGDGLLTVEIKTTGARNSTLALFYSVRWLRFCRVGSVDQLEQTAVRLCAINPDAPTNLAAYSHSQRYIARWKRWIKKRLLRNQGSGG